MSSPVDEGRTGSNVAKFRKNCLTAPCDVSAHRTQQLWSMARVGARTSNTVVDVQRDRLSGLIHEYHLWGSKVSHTPATSGVARPDARARSSPCRCGCCIDLLPV